jgi:hypothetical protein
MKRLEFAKLMWRHRPPHAVQMLIIMLLCMVLLLSVTFKAFAVELTQEEKTEILKQAYQRIYAPPAPEPEPELPLVFPEPVKVAAVVPKALPRVDVCRRHGMRKVVTGRSWRCRKR